MVAPAKRDARTDTSPEGDEETLRGWLIEHARDFVRMAKNSWLIMDRRTLGLSRILLGFYLVMDLFRRTSAWTDMFADTGVLPNYVILEKPQAAHFSIVYAFTSAPELWVLWLVILGFYLCLLVGYRTKLAQVASLLIVTGMNGRVLLIENGGYVVQSLLLLWTCFMPMGDRFSLDAMISSMKRRREMSAAELNDRSDLIEPFRLAPFFSIVGLALCMQIAAVYYFNVVHKFGPGWKRDWTAVFYVLYVDRMVTPLVAHVRDYVPYVVTQIMTVAVLAIEAAIAFCVLLPQLIIYGLDVKLWMRRAGLLMIDFLHIGFGSTFVLGPFAWGLCIFSSLFLGHEDWEAWSRAMRRQKRARYVIFDATSGATLFLCRVVARMDRFGLIRFREAATEEERALRLAVADQEGNFIGGGHVAIADIVAALPIGPVFAWIIRAPLVRSLVDALLGFAKGRASRFFGLAKERPAGREIAPLSYRFKWLGRVASELACLVMFMAALNQALVELWSTQRKWRDDVIAPLNKRLHRTGKDAIQPQPEAMQTLTHKMRFLQGWFMFSPNPVTVDGTIVVDAVTVDGRHVDPFWRAPPNFDLLHAQSFSYNQIWSDYFNRIQGEGSRPYQKPMLDYMRRLPERTGNPNDALVSGEVYWVSDHNPKPRTHESWGYQKTLLFTFGASGPPVYPSKSGS